MFGNNCEGYCVDKGDAVKVGFRVVGAADGPIGTWPFFDFVCFFDGAGDSFDDFLFEAFGDLIGGLLFDFPINFPPFPFTDLPPIIIILAPFPPFPFPLEEDL